MCIKLGTRIVVSGEAKKLVDFYQQKALDTWHLIMQASALLREQHNDLWNAIRELYPELDNYELSYSDDTLIVIKKKAF